MSGRHYGYGGLPRLIDAPYEAGPWTRRQREDYLAANVDWRARWNGVWSDAEKYGRHPDDYEKVNPHDT